MDNPHIRLILPPRRLGDEQEAALLVIESAGALTLTEARRMVEELNAYAALWDANAAIQRRYRIEEGDDVR